MFMYLPLFIVFWYEEFYYFYLKFIRIFDIELKTTILSQQKYILVIPKQLSKSVKMAVLDVSLKNPRLEPKNSQQHLKDLIKSTKSKRKALKNSKELVPSADKLRRIILLQNTMSRFCRKKAKREPKKSLFGSQK